jgi:HK97 family phage prohead protease
MEPRTRSVRFDASTDTDGHTLEGYAAVFDSPTVINSWEGHFVEVIERGAFARTIRGRPVLQFDHGSHPLFGSMPVGVIEELREDDKGLYVRAALHSGAFFEPLREAIASGSIDGMSFRFTIPEDGQTVDTSGELPVHTLTDLDVQELGPVVWPAYKETTVGVRAKELAQIITSDEEIRTELFRALLFAKPSDEESDTETVDLEPTDETTAETTDEEQPCGCGRSVQDAVPESVREEETVHPASAYQERRAQIMAARMERARRHLEDKEIEDNA